MPKPNFYIHFPSINGEWIEPPAQDMRVVLKMIMSIKGMPASFATRIKKVYNTAPPGSDIDLIIDGTNHSIAFYNKQSNTLFPIPSKFL